MNHVTGSVMGSGLAFVMGLLMGAGTGLLLAPRPGRQTRQQLRSLADDISEHAGHIAEDARQTVTAVIEHGRRLVG